MDINFSTSSAIYWWRPAAWLRVTGSDAADFLQGQFTNDLRGPGGGAPVGAVYGLWLDVKGKVLADSFVVRGVGGAAGDAEFWIGSYFSPAAAIQARLESHIIADDVLVEDRTAAWAGVTRLGPGAFEALVEKCHVIRDTFPGWVFRGRRAREENAEWVFPLAAADTVARELADCPALDAGEMERRRLDARIPAVPVDVGPGDLPNEGALEAEAISFTKGCYLGQEVMARLKSMGKVRRRLLRVRGAIRELPPLPAGLYVGERQVGELRSAALGADGGFVGLAMVSLLHVAPGAGLAWTAGGVPSVQLEDQP